MLLDVRDIAYMNGAITSEHGEDASDETYEEG